MAGCVLLLLCIDALCKRLGNNLHLANFVKRYYDALKLCWGSGYFCVILLDNYKVKGRGREREAEREAVRSCCCRFAACQVHKPLLPQQSLSTVGLCNCHAQNSIEPKILPLNFYDFSRKCTRISMVNFAA